MGDIIERQRKKREPRWQYTAVALNLIIRYICTQHAMQGSKSIHKRTLTSLLSAERVQFFSFRLFGYNTNVTRFIYHKLKRLMCDTCPEDLNEVACKAIDTCQGLALTELTAQRMSFMLMA